MLVLTRKIGEKILVPHCQLSVTVLEITPNRVRLGVSAPADVVVHREEVATRMTRDMPGPTERPLVSARVLLATHDRFLLTSYASDLGQCGATVAAASSGLECAERLRAFTPDVLVLEASLLWGGAEGVLALIEEQPELRPRAVMLLAPRSQRSLLYRLSSFRVDDYQTKPLTSSGLAERIRLLLSPGRERVLLPR